jgi:hypothetical protein
MIRGTTFLLTAVSCLLACGAGNSATIQCSADRTPLDGVCVSLQVADYVACVRAQGARLGEDRSRKLSAEAGYAGTRAAVASDVGEKLQKEYSASDSNTLEIIHACGAMKGADEDVCGKSGSALVACGYENDPSWLAGCQASTTYRACLANHAGDCDALSACGFADMSRQFCAGASMGKGSASCEATGSCTHGCGNDVACKCSCFASMSPSAADRVGKVGQCFNLHCASCGSEGTGGCDRCFVEHCQGTFDRVCRGH